MNQRKLGIILSYFYTGLHILVNLWYVPLLLNTIGQSEYGLYQLLGSLISYLTVMESLLSAGILRFYCKYNSLGDEKRKENILAISQRIYQLIAIIVFIFGALLIWMFPIVYKSTLNEKQLAEARYVIGVLVINIGLNLIGYVYVAIITAHERFVFEKILMIIFAVIQPVSVALVIRKLPYTLTIVVIQCFLNCVMILIRRWYSIYKIGAKIKYYYRDIEFIKQLCVFSVGIILAMIADQIFWKGNQLLIGKLMNTEAVAVYAVGSQIFLNYSPIGTAISSVFLPRLSVLYDKEHNMNALSQLFIKVGRLTFLVLMSVLLGFGLYGKEFILIWTGELYIDAYYVALIIMIPFTVNVMQNLGLSILQIVNQYAVRGKLYIYMALFSIWGAIILIKRFGIIGGACSTAIAMAIGDGVVMNIYYAKKVGLNMVAFWREVLSIIPAVLLALLAGLVIKQIHLDSLYMQFITHIVLFIFVYLIFTYLVGMNQYEKDLIKKILNRFTARKHK